MFDVFAPLTGMIPRDIMINVLRSGFPPPDGDDTFIKYGANNTLTMFSPPYGDHMRAQMGAGGS